MINIPVLAVPAVRDAKRRKDLTVDARLWVLGFHTSAQKTAVDSVEALAPILICIWNLRAGHSSLPCPHRHIYIKKKKKSMRSCVQLIRQKTFWLEVFVTLPSTRRINFVVNLFCSFSQRSFIEAENETAWLTLSYIYIAEWTMRLSRSSKRFCLLATWSNLQAIGKHSAIHLLLLLFQSWGDGTAAWTSSLFIAGPRSE